MQTKISLEDIQIRIPIFTNVLKDDLDTQLSYLKSGNFIVDIDHSTHIEFTVDRKDIVEVIEEPRKLEPNMFKNTRIRVKLTDFECKLNPREKYVDTITYTITGIGTII